MTEAPQQPVPQAPVPAPIPGQLPNAPGAVASLVCGIIGVALVCAGLVLGIVAIMQSKKAKRLIAANPGQYGGAGMATAGFILGIIATIWGAFWAVYFVVIIIVGISVAAAA